MKPDKSYLQTLTLLATALSLILALFTILFDTNRFDTENIYLMAMLSIVAVCITVIYIMLIIRRVNPKQYIYVSYTSADKETVDCIVQMLDEELKRISKYRFEILTSDNIPFGSDIHKTMREYLEKANIVLVVVSENYLRSEWCNQEFVSFCNMDKKIIPIVTESYSHLSELPKNISNIKALSLRFCKTKTDFEDATKTLARDLVKQRRD